MTQFEWDSLRRGDRVSVHDASREHTAVLYDGIVAIVGTSRRQRDIGIRMLDNDTIVWPPRMRVHRKPVAVDESCAWCRATAEGRS